MSAIRVLHVPARTPYVRKLQNDTIHILNGTSVAGGPSFPRDATLQWLLNNQPWDWWDVVHLHHIDFEPLPRLRAVLAACRRARKPVVFTAHDITPVFGDRVEHHRRLRTLAEYRVPFVCLTPAAEQEIRRCVGATTALIPHGYVSSPGCHRPSEHRSPGVTRFLLYGSLRANRDVSLVLACWRFARDLADSTLHLLLRAPSRASLVEDGEIWRSIREHAEDCRLQVDVRPYPSDEEVDDAMTDADCLVLPYRWASHSGQLEHAFDLGLLPVVSRTGFLPDQVALHRSLVPPPQWFEWPADSPYDHGARLLGAMRAAHTAVQSGHHSPEPDQFAEHRRIEHAKVLRAHLDLYENSRPPSNRAPDRPWTR